MSKLSHDAMDRIVSVFIFAFGAFIVVSGFAYAGVPNGAEDWLAFGFVMFVVIFIWLVAFELWR